MAMNKTFLAATVLIIASLVLSTCIVFTPNANASDSGGTTSGWTNWGSNLNNTFSYGAPSQWSGSPSVPFTSIWSQTSSAPFALTGDLLGTGQLEVVVSSSPNLNVYNGEGNLVWSANAVSDSSLSGGTLSSINLASINGTMVVLATVSTGGQYRNGPSAILVYSGIGALLRIIQGPVAWAFDQVRLA